MGGIYKYTTKSGDRWRIVYDGPPDPETGERRQRSKRGFTRKRDAQRALREILGDVDDGTYVEPDQVRQLPRRRVAPIDQAAQRQGRPPSPRHGQRSHPPSVRT